MAFDIKTDVSVIINCFNQENFIEETLDSVLSQTRMDFIKEIIVIDDGSVDLSGRKILDKAAKNPLIKYIFQENKGLPSARNAGINAATGNLIALLDGDDVWLNKKIEKQVECFKQHPEAGLVYCDFYKADSNNLNIRTRVKANSYFVNSKNTQSIFFIYDGPVIPSSVMIKREVFEKVSLFDPSLKIGEDTEMWLRIAGKYNFHHIAEPLLLKRQVANSLGSNAESRVEYFEKINDKITGLYPELSFLVKKRNARRKTKLALYYSKTGNREFARKNYREAIRLDWLLWKPYFYFALSFLPQHSENNIAVFFKRIRVIFK